MRRKLKPGDEASVHQVSNIRKCNDEPCGKELGYKTSCLPFNVKAKKKNNPTGTLHTKPGLWTGLWIGPWTGVRNPFRVVLCYYYSSDTQCEHSTTKN